MTLGFSFNYLLISTEPLSGRPLPENFASPMLWCYLFEQLMFVQEKHTTLLFRIYQILIIRSRCFAKKCSCKNLGSTLVGSNCLLETHSKGWLNLPLDMTTSSESLSLELQYRELATLLTLPKQVRQGRDSNYQLQSVIKHATT